jgi:hypothetical protein
MFQLFCPLMIFKSYFFHLNFSLQKSNLGCYSIKYGSRGYGHSGISSLGLMCDAKDLEWQWYTFYLLAFFFHKNIFSIKFSKFEN